MTWQLTRQATSSISRHIQGEAAADCGIIRGIGGRGSQPGLGALAAVEGLRRAVESPGVDRRETLLGYTSAYVVAAKLLTKLGAADLAMLAADRCATAAVDADSLSARGLAAYQAACALLQADRSGEAERVAVSMGEHGRVGAAGCERTGAGARVGGGRAVVDRGGCGGAAGRSGPSVAPALRV
jgi:hypothetical protein